MSRNIKKIHFIASTSIKAQKECRKFRDVYGDSPSEEADVIVVLGGDGFMLQNLRNAINHQKPVYGINCGSVGFLMNKCCIENLLERLSNAIEHAFNPLRMLVFNHDNTMMNAKIHAINEVSVFRRGSQAAKLKVIINNKVRLEELVCDGLIISTPVGSTGYNFSAHGPILPLDSRLLALTPVSPCRPRHWRGVILPEDADVEIEVLKFKDRLVNATADNSVIEDVSRIKVSQFKESTIRILSDPDQSWSDRILAEQFHF